MTASQAAQLSQALSIHRNTNNPQQQHSHLNSRKSRSMTGKNNPNRRKGMVSRITIQLLISIVLFGFFFLYLFILHWMTLILPQRGLSTNTNNGALSAPPRAPKSLRSSVLRDAIIRDAMIRDAPPWSRGDLVHVVLTRFQQSQGQLVHLGLARAELFRTFCLPTMAKQTNQNFLWMIRTDDHLDPAVKAMMQDMLRPYPNFLLVESNKRRNESKGFRDPEEYSDILDVDRIVSGDVSLAVQYYNAAKTRVVVETRLDADDGLHVKFIDIIQRSAKARFFHSSKQEGKKEALVSLKKDSSWVYWCADHHFEWHYDKQKPRGSLNFTREMYCITPGLSIGYAPEVDLEAVPKNQHYKLHRHIGPCYHEDDAQCIMHMADIRPAAIRARTPTSAGMKNVGELAPSDENEDAETRKQMEELNSLRWQGKIVSLTVSFVDAMLSCVVPFLSSTYMHSVFNARGLSRSNHPVLHRSMGVSALMAADVNQYMQDHLIEIATDNLKGQCSVGHSCKKSAKERLKGLMDPSYTPNITVSTHSKSTHSKHTEEET
jgi:hypothetical protein